MRSVPPPPRHDRLSARRQVVAAVAAENPVRTRTAPQAVVVRPSDHPVVARLAEDGVVFAPAGHVVVAVPRVHAVAPAFALDAVDAGAGDEQVTPEPPRMLSAPGPPST